MGPRHIVGQGLAKTSNKVSLDHKIKLKKRLAKAYRKAGIAADERPTSPEAQVKKPMRTTALRIHQSHKPDPLRAARDAQQRYAREMEEEQARKDAEIDEAKRKKEEQIQSRKDKKKKMNARTRKGQPVLSNHIDNLLEKIQKTMS